MPSFATLMDRCGGPRLLRLLALLLALAISTPMLPAQEADHVNGRDKVCDPTGAWLVRIADGGPFQLIVFHKGGTVSQDSQGESAFDPRATNPPAPPDNVITSPQGGVWQKTGWNTFAVTLLAIEYQVDPPNATLFLFAKVQYLGRLNESGDRIELNALLTHFDANGNQLDPKGQGSPYTANGVRIPLEVLPYTSHHLTIPPSPPTPQ